jgi:Domain of unknown function (DUF4129)
MPRAGSSRSLPVLAAGLVAVVAVAAVTRWLATVDVSSRTASTWASRAGTDLVGFLFVLALLVGAIWLVAAFFMGDAGPRAPQHRRRRSPWTALVIGAGWIALALLLVWLRGHLGNHAVALHGHTGAGGTRRSTTPVSPAAGSVDWPVILALASVAAVGLAAWMLLPGRRRAGTAIAPPPTDAAAGAFAVAEPNAEPLPLDPRQAVLAAYHRLLGALRARGLARQASETPFEHVDRVLAGEAAAGPARSVVSAFELARFSDHEITPATRDEALGALGSTLSALEQRS